VEAIVPGFPINEWPMVYIDPDTCISCGACVPECPYSAIFAAEDLPSAYVAKGGEYINRPHLRGHYEGTNHHGNPVVLNTVYQLNPGQVVDLTQDDSCNNAFFRNGPGYSARDHDNGM
jgi:ferredoxin